MARLLRALPDVTAVRVHSVGRALLERGVTEPAMPAFLFARLEALTGSERGTLSRRTAAMVRLYDVDRAALADVLQRSGLSCRAFFKRRHALLAALAADLAAWLDRDADDSLEERSEIAVGVAVRRARALAALGAPDAARVILLDTMRDLPVTTARTDARLRLTSASIESSPAAARANLAAARAAIATLPPDSDERRLLEGESLATELALELAEAHDVAPAATDRVARALGPLLAGADPRAEAIMFAALARLAEAQCFRGEYAQTRDTLRAADAVSGQDRANVSALAVRLDVIRAWVRMLQLDRYEDAWHDLQSALLTAVRRNYLDEVTLASTLLAVQSEFRGDASGQLGNARIAQAAGSTLNGHLAIAESLIGGAELQRGRPAAAHSEFARARALATGRASLEFDVDYLRCGYYLRAGDYRTALAIMDELMPRLPGAGHSNLVGAVLSTRAGILAKLERDDEARDCIGNALEMLEGGGSRIFLIRAYDRAHRLTGERRYAHASRRLHVELPVVDQDHLRGLRVETPLPASATASPAGRLTRREGDVAPLVAQGLTNREIAARLGISPKTVEHHVESILHKLDIPKRRQLTTEALHRDR